MTRVKTTSEVEIYEVDGTERYGKKLLVKSHWSNEDRVVLEVEVEGRTHQVTVLASDLRLAVGRCSRG